MASHWTGRPFSAGSARTASASSGPKSSACTGCGDGGRRGADIGRGGREGRRGTTRARGGQAAARVREFASALGSALEGKALAHVETWLERLQEWNARIDSTAARSPHELVDLMLADALFLATRIHGPPASSTSARAPARRASPSRSCAPTCG